MSWERPSLTLELNECSSETALATEAI